MNWCTASHQAGNKLRVSVNEVVRVRFPLMPVMVMGKLPRVGVPVVDKVRIEELPVVLLGLNVPDTNEGWPEILKATAEPNPFKRFMNMTGELLVPGPGGITKFEGADSEKSPFVCTVRLTGVVRVKLPLIPSKRTV